jgi:hypothetical protein
MLTGHHIIGNEMQSSASHTQRKTKKKQNFLRNLFLFFYNFGVVLKKNGIGRRMFISMLYSAVRVSPHRILFSAEKRKNFFMKK